MLKQAIFLLIILILTTVLGCGPRSSINHSSFFLSHETNEYFESLAEKRGYEMPGFGSGASVGGPTGEKDFSITIKSDSISRDQLMREYRNFIKDQLEKSSVYIRGDGVTGNISGFDFNYQKSGVTGIFKASALVDHEGNIRIEIFMYEHQ